MIVIFNGAQAESKPALHGFLCKGCPGGCRKKQGVCCEGALPRNGGNPIGRLQLVKGWGGATLVKTTARAASGTAVVVVEPL